MIAALAGLAFVAYAWGAAAGVEWLDAGELTAAAFTLGVSHPPGQAVYTLLGRLAAMLPLGEVAFRLNLLSAATAALAVAGAARLARELAPGAGLFALLPAAAVAASPLVVEQATRAEVYAPLLAATTWAAVLVVRFRRLGDAGDLLAATLLLALGVGLQPLLAAAVALPLAASALSRRAPRLAPHALALAALGLVPAASLLVRARAETPPLFLWGDPATPRALVDVLLGRAYEGNFALAGLGDRLLGHALLLAEGTGLALVIGGLVGLGVAAGRRVPGALPLLGASLAVVAATAAQRVFHPANPDIHGYLVPALPLLAAGIAAAAPVARGGLLVALALLCLEGPRRHVFPAWRPADDTLRYHDVTAGALPPGPAVYVTSSDHGLFTALYERLVAGARPDVALANDHLVTSSWFLGMLKRAVPPLFVPYLDDGGRMDDLLRRLVDENRAAGRPVVFEDDLAVDLELGGEMGRRIAAESRYRRAVRELPLLAELPAVTPVFIHEPWQDELVARAREARPAPPATAPIEARLLHAWQLLLAGDPGAEAALSAAGPGMRTATARMLVRRGREADAVAQLERAGPEDDGAAMMLAAIHANAGRFDDAVRILDALLARRPEHPRARQQRAIVERMRASR
jgi:hypothetical protein